MIGWSRNEHRRASEVSRAQFAECCVRPFERKCLRLGANRNPARELHEFLAVAASQVRHRANLPLLPQVTIRELRDVAHVNSATHDDAATVDRAQCRWRQRADWRENNGRIELLRRCFIRSARPDGAETDSELLRLPISRARASAYVPSLMPLALDHDVRRRAKAVKAGLLRTP